MNRNKIRNKLLEVSEYSLDCGYAMDNKFIEYQDTCDAKHQDAILTASHSNHLIKNQPFYNFSDESMTIKSTEITRSVSTSKKKYLKVMSGKDEKKLSKVDSSNINIPQNSIYLERVSSKKYVQKDQFLNKSKIGKLKLYDARRQKSNCDYQLKKENICQKFNNQIIINKQNCISLKSKSLKKSQIFNKVISNNASKSSLYKQFREEDYCQSSNRNEDFVPNVKQQPINNKQKLHINLKSKKQENRLVDMKQNFLKNQINLNKVTPLNCKIEYSNQVSLLQTSGATSLCLKNQNKQSTSHSNSQFQIYSIKTTQGQLIIQSNQDKSQIKLPLSIASRHVTEIKLSNKSNFHKINNKSASPIQYKHKHTLRVSPNPILYNNHKNIQKQSRKKQENTNQINFKNIIYSFQTPKKQNNFFEDNLQANLQTIPFQNKYRMKTQQNKQQFQNRFSKQINSIVSQRKLIQCRISRKLDELSQRANSLVRMYSEQSKGSPKIDKTPRILLRKSQKLKNNQILQNKDVAVPLFELKINLNSPCAIKITKNKQNSQSLEQNNKFSSRNILRNNILTHIFS